MDKREAKKRLVQFGFATVMATGAYLATPEVVTAIRSGRDAQTVEAESDARISNVPARLPISRVIR
ncbi:hypothetical protein KKC08_00045 [Patescibacteria group bacterium]|nr:hypothetical protein [Patescibacteria group bacterium]MCG2701606.1 hypothetical protein [Candidatus Parcubacteria bacterium]MBU4264931.1 hypothetical protein [Patescibacteria group bacterium]MBU4389768.1 hypothetical protein [Patescibacteria group bacterium]MBU4396544.1 hypothetical protein [Patescibacteria group bacterium]